MKKLNFSLNERTILLRSKIIPILNKKQKQIQNQCMKVCRSERYHWDRSFNGRDHPFQGRGIIIPASLDLP